MTTKIYAEGGEHMLKNLLARIRGIKAVEAIETSLHEELKATVSSFEDFALSRRNEILSRVADLEAELADLKKVLSAADAVKSV